MDRRTLLYLLSAPVLKGMVPDSWLQKPCDLIEYRARQLSYLLDGNGSWIEICSGHDHEPVCGTERQLIRFEPNRDSGVRSINNVEWPDCGPCTVDWFSIYDRPVGGNLICEGIVRGYWHKHCDILQGQGFGFCAGDIKLDI